MIISCVSAAVLTMPLCGCDESSESVQQASSEESDDYADEIVITVGGRSFSRNEFLYYVKYYAENEAGDLGSVEDWSKEYSEGVSYQDHVLSGAVEWLKHDEAARIRSRELKCGLTDEENAAIGAKWDELVKEKGSEQALLDEMAGYYCNEKLYKDMESGFMLNDKCRDITEKNGKSDYDSDIDRIAHSRVEVTYTSFYNMIDLNDLDNF